MKEYRGIRSKRVEGRELALDVHVADASDGGARGDPVTGSAR